ncbi:MAG: TatD family hydrolase [Coriobacteriales bacterium]|jgi:TatD DNase family protein|nr:TatD family hydrolase [Coriobacteriales bacterium]
MRESGVYDSNLSAEDIFDAQFRDSKGRVVPPPELTAKTPVADTHCHLDMLRHPALALARAAAHGVEFLVSVCDPTEDAAYTYRELPHWRKAAHELLGAWNAELPAGRRTTEEAPQTRVIIGCHPHNAAKYTPETERTLKTLAARPLTCGIGEIGLDYHYDYSPRETQREVFARQLALAADAMLPVALHLRESHADGLAILREAGPLPAGVLLHCYNLDYDTLRPFLDLGCYVAFGGALTFKKSDEVRDAAARVPLERLLTETDAPFMAPVPLRGTVCGPECTVFTAACLTELRLEAAEEAEWQPQADANDANGANGTASCVSAEQPHQHGSAHLRHRDAELAARGLSVPGQDASHEAVAILNTIYETARRLFDRSRE